VPAPPDFNPLYSAKLLKYNDKTVDMRTPFDILRLYVACLIGVQATKLERATAINQKKETFVRQPMKADNARG